MDMSENDRPARIKELEMHYDGVIESIRSNITSEVQEEMSQEEQDFMKAAKRGQAKIAPPVMPGENSMPRLREL